MLSDIGKIMFEINYFCCQPKMKWSRKIDKKINKRKKKLYKQIGITIKDYFICLSPCDELVFVFNGVESSTATMSFERRFNEFLFVSMFGVGKFGTLFVSLRRHVGGLCPEDIDEHAELEWISKLFVNISHGGNFGILDFFPLLFSVLASLALFPFFVFFKRISFFEFTLPFAISSTLGSTLLIRRSDLLVHSVLVLRGSRDWTCLWSDRKLLS